MITQRNLKKRRLKALFTLHMLRSMDSFKLSKEDAKHMRGVKLTDNDVTHVLATILERRLQ